jgi:hypothetical protein
MEISEVLEKDKDIIDENQNDALVEEKNKLQKFSERKAFDLRPRRDEPLI